RSSDLDVRRFWAIVGRSPLTDRAFPYPLRAESEELLQTIVHRWMEEAFVRDRWHWEPGANMLARPPFPARRRVVAHYLERDAYDYLVRNTSYVVLTDETEDDDPPLFELRVGT